MLKKAKAQAKAHIEDLEGLPQGILESSRQIWLAGLGAFSRAQAEGMKVFETLVDQGRSLESRTRRAATETAAAAAGAAAQKAKEVHAMAGGTWDKLEQVFEDRVARALSKLGVYTQNDVERLAERVDALSEAVNALLKAEGRGPLPAAKAAKARREAPGKTSGTGAEVDRGRSRGRAGHGKVASRTQGDEAQGGLIPRARSGR